MKSLMLLNARRRRRKSKRNPSKSYRKNYDAIFRKGRRKRSRKSGVRRARRLSIKRYSLGGGRQGLAVRARRIYVSRRGRKSALIVARNPRRRMRRNPMIPSMSGITAQVKGLFSKENLTIAAGGVAATVVTQYALNLKKDGKSLLPMPADPNMAKAASVAYAVAIPFAGALLTRKFSPGAAKGMMFGGLINGLLTAWKAYGGTTYAQVTGTSEYLQYTPTSSVGAAPPGYMASSRFAGVRPVNGPLDNSSAFPADAWNVN
jgi:hypothetical protein